MVAAEATPTSLTALESACALRYTIDVDARMVYSRGWGHVSDRDLLDHQQQLARDPRFDRDFSQLIDFLDVIDMVAVKADTLKTLARQNLWGAHSRRAFVVVQPESFGLVRMFQTRRELADGTDQMRLFTTREAALAWLARTEE